MEKSKLIKKVNNFLEKKTFVYTDNILSSEEAQYNSETKFKFKIVGEKEMISVGTAKNFMVVEIDIISTNNPILVLFIQNEVSFERMYYFKHAITRVIEKILSIFDINNVIIDKVNFN